MIATQRHAGPGQNILYKPMDLAKLRSMGPARVKIQPMGEMLLAEHGNGISVVAELRTTTANLVRECSATLSRIHNAHIDAAVRSPAITVLGGVKGALRLLGFESDDRIPRSWNDKKAKSRAGQEIVCADLIWRDRFLPSLYCVAGYRRSPEQFRATDVYKLHLDLGELLMQADAAVYTIQTGLWLEA